jgi:hypothetical protein
MKGSPPFTNSRGQTIDGRDQVDALAQAQSIGTTTIVISRISHTKAFILFSV